ncbi:MAG: efflux RND transporter periplasmic adaptor subunit [Thermoanaerobaculia bacterium]|nr:efflux RND transporter periplasmic adaptor subunit [Thermoanaerobaculia bacterium]
MKRIIHSLLLIALIVTAACSNEADATGSDESTTLPEDVREIAAEITNTSTPSETPIAVDEGAYETTGELVSPSQSSVAPKVPGIVARVYVDEGDFVRRGEPLAALDTNYLTLDLERAEAELSRARSMEAEALRDLERKKELRSTDSIPQSLYDRTLATSEQATAAREGAEAAVLLAKRRLADAVIRSPLTGVVAERHADVGEHLGDGGVAFVVNQTAPLRLRFSIPERYLGRVSRGQKVIAAVDPYPGEQFVGEVRTIGGVVDPSSRTIMVEAELPNADNRLRPGLFARVAIQWNSRSGD